MIGLKRGTVKLEEHNPEWSSIFAKEKELLINALKGYLLGIEHIGSTSIPALKAKPIIDIEVGIDGIDDLRKVERIVTILKGIGYEWRRQNSLPDHHIFAKGSEEKRTEYLHLVEYKGNIWLNDIRFRDYLRNSPKAAFEYEHLKVELSLKYPSDREKYTKGKGTFFNKILKLANKTSRK